MLNHYVTYHNVDENNWFFQKLFQIKDKTLLKRCLRCDKFLVTEKQKAVHNFLNIMKTVRLFHLKKNRLIF